MNYREASRTANRARTAISTENWASLRYCGNQFERARYSKEAWKAPGRQRGKQFGRRLPHLGGTGLLLP